MHPNDLYNSVKIVCLGKNLFLKLNVKMLSAIQIANYQRYKVDFVHAGTYLSKLQIEDMILGGRGLACSGMPKEAIKTLRSQKLKKV